LGVYETNIAVIIKIVYEKKAIVFVLVLI